MLLCKLVVGGEIFLNCFFKFFSSLKFDYFFSPLHFETPVVYLYWVYSLLDAQQIVHDNKFHTDSTVAEILFVL